MLSALSLPLLYSRISPRSQLPLWVERAPGAWKEGIPLNVPGGMSVMRFRSSFGFSVVHMKAASKQIGSSKKAQ